MLNDSARMANVEFLTEMIAICGEVGPRKLVLHPSSEPIADGERERRIRNSIASIGVLRKEAARIGAELCIEDRRVPVSGVIPTSCAYHRPLS